MFLDVPDALFTEGGVPVAMIRAGEPVLRRSVRPEAVAAARRAAVSDRPRGSFFDRLLHPAAS